MTHTGRIAWKTKQMLKIGSGHLQNGQSCVENISKRFRSIDFIKSQQDLNSKPHIAFLVLSLVFMLQFNKDKNNLKCLVLNFKMQNFRKLLI